MLNEIIRISEIKLLYIRKMNSAEPPNAPLPFNFASFQTLPLYCITIYR